MNPEPCNSKREFYKHLQEVKLMPVKDKIEYSFQALGIIWGLATVIIVVAILMTWFKSEIWEFVRNPKQSIENFFSEKKAT